MIKLREHAQLIFFRNGKIRMKEMCRKGGCIIVFVCCCCRFFSFFNFCLELKCRLCFLSPPFHLHGIHFAASLHHLSILVN